MHLHKIHHLNSFTANIMFEVTARLSSQVIIILKSHELSTDFPQTLGHVVIDSSFAGLCDLAVHEILTRDPLHCLVHGTVYGGLGTLNWRFRDHKDEG